MSANTSPDNITYPVSTDNITPLETVFATMASSIQTALSKRAQHSYTWTNAAARTAQTGMVAGDKGYQQDTTVEYKYNGTAWFAVPHLYTWANAAARTAQTGMANGDTGYQQDTLTTYTYDGSNWQILSVATGFNGFSKTGTQTIANGGTAPNLTTMNAGEFTTNPGFTIASGVFTCTVPGMYWVSLVGTGTTVSATQYGFVQITHNTTTYTVQTAAGNNASAQLGGSIAKLLKLAVNDTISFQIRQVSGGTNSFTYFADAYYAGPVIA